MSPAKPSPAAVSTSRPIVTGMACALLLVLPLAMVRWVPSTDLPQLLAQLELLGDAGRPESSLRVQWWHPNKLGYLPLGAGWLVGQIGGDPVVAGRIGLALVIAGWVAAMHFLARARSLGGGQAVLASLLVFNVSFHWGFVNFLLGLPLFALWVHQLERSGTSVQAGRGRHGPTLLALGVLLYFAHVLWLAMALIYLAADCARGLRWRLLSYRLAWLAPVLLVTVFWYGLFRQTGVDQRLFWGQPPWWRLHPTWLVESLFGGLQGPVEPVVAGALALWLALGLGQHRGRRLCGLDRPLAAGAALLLAAAFLLPAVFHHTILFAARWLAPGLALLVLAAPPPKLSPLLARTVPWLLAASLVTSLASGWLGFERQELEGFVGALDEIGRQAEESGPGLSVLGLDFVRTSPSLDGFPYHHLPSYAQVRYGVTTQRSFADDPASLVVFDKLPHVYPWTDRLDWQPKKLRSSDLDHFDLLLALAGQELHARFEADPRLEALSRAERGEPWRLYRILPAEGAAP